MSAAMGPMVHTRAACGLAPTTPICMPSQGPWLVKILARENRFVVGLYRRHMKVIGYLGTLDRIFGVPGLRSAMKS